MRSLPASATTRRTAIGGAVGGLLVLAGCDAGGPEPVAGPGPGSRADGSAQPEDPDAAVVDRVVTELDELAAVVDAASRQRPALRDRLVGLAALHRAHRAVLVEAEDPPPPLRLRGGSRELVEQVLRRERAGRDRLADLAVEAQSGALARLLASMSAGIAAHLAADAAGARS